MMVLAFATSTAFSEKTISIYVDLDGDKTNDMIVSEPLSTFGNAGGYWTVYLRRNSELKKVGSIFAHPKAISFEYDHLDLDKVGDLSKGKALCRIWTYSRINGRTGSVSYYVVRENSVTPCKSLNIYIGDPADPNDFGSKIYTAIFKQSPVPFSFTP